MARSSGFSADEGESDVLWVYSDGSSPSLVGALAQDYREVRVVAADHDPRAQLPPGSASVVVALADLVQASELADRLLRSAQLLGLRLAILPGASIPGVPMGLLVGVAAESVERVDEVPLVTLTRSAEGPAATAVLWGIVALNASASDASATDAAPPQPEAPPSFQSPDAKVAARPTLPSRGKGAVGVRARARRMGRRDMMVAGALAVLVLLLAVLGGVTDGRWAGLALWGLLGTALAAGLLALYFIWRGLRRLTRVALDLKSGQKALRSTPTKVARVARMSQRNLETSQLTLQEVHEFSLRALRELRSGREALDVLAARQDALTAALGSGGKLQKGLLESFMQLQAVAPVDRPMPLPGGWAASEDLLLWMVQRVMAKRPQLILDVGSGQSTVWMAAALRALGGDGRIVAIDHDERFGAATMDLVRSQGLERWVEVRHAPLVAQQVEGREVRWYQPDMIADLHDIGLVSVDGPPAATGPLARWPALPLVAQRLLPGAELILDDLVRADEREVAGLWQESFPEWEVERLDHFEKRAVVFRAPDGGRKVH